VIDSDFGVIVWLEHQFDEHIIECEFGKDIELYHVSIDG
jgi:hypothetical protein